MPIIDNIPDFEPSIFRSYDIRGIVDETISEEVYFYLGNLLAQWCLETLGTLEQDSPNPLCVLGYDGRLSSPQLAKALSDGVRHTGMKLCNIGLVPTPTLYHASQLKQASLALMITGSHNPPQYNGIKMMMHGKPFFGEQIANLPARAKQKLLLELPANEHGQEECEDIQAIYQDFLLKNYTGDKDNSLKIGWDMGNGAAGDTITHLTAALPGQHFLLNQRIDGTFPGHHPDPSKPENMVELQELVARENLDIGIAFDGDGDRLGVVDNKGRMLYGDQLLPILSHDILQDKPNSLILADVKISSAMLALVRSMGGQTKIVACGHSLVKSAMKKLQAEFAAELSGHLFFADNHCFDDAIYAAIKLMNRVAYIQQHEQRDLSDLVDELPKFCATEEIRIKVDETQKYSIMQNIIDHVKELSQKNGKNYLDIDGIRVEDGDNWWLIRASNTENILVFRAEADNPRNLAAQIREAHQMLQTQNIIDENLSKLEQDNENANLT